MESICQKGQNRRNGDNVKLSSKIPNWIESEIDRFDVIEQKTRQTNNTSASIVKNANNLRK